MFREGGVKSPVSFYRPIFFGGRREVWNKADAERGWSIAPMVRAVHILGDANALQQTAAGTRRAVSGLFRVVVRADGIVEDIDADRTGRPSF